MDTVHTDNGDRHEAVDENLEKQIAASDVPEIAKKTLRRVNKIRRFFGAEPLLDLKKGMSGAATNCPIFNSLKGLKARGVHVSSVDGKVIFFINDSEKFPADVIAEAINGDAVAVHYLSDGELAIYADDLADFVIAFDEDPDSEVRHRYSFKKDLV